MPLQSKIAAGAVSCLFGTVLFGMSLPAQAGDAGAFIGGVFATKLLDNLTRQTQASEAQAAAAAQPKYVIAAPPQKSTEQRLAELDKLAAGGYITPEEYKRKKQQILNECC